MATAFAPLSHLGTLEGTGRVIVDGADLGPARYEVSIHRTLLDGREGRGTFSASREVAWAALSARRRVLLRLETGESLAIGVSRGDVSAARISFVVLDEPPAPPTERRLATCDDAAG